MKTEHPILFNGEMVRAILEGRKFQTRRIVRVQPKDPPKGHTYVDLGSGQKCPYGKRGDRLWVRENGWQRPDRTEKDLREGADTWPPYIYDVGNVYSLTPEQMKEWKWKRRPSIHMPRWASRINLEVKDVYLHRIQDITEEQSKAEGIQWDQGWEEQCGEGFTGGGGFLDYLSKDDSFKFAFAKESFRSLWDSINAARGYGWDKNPYVWAVSFEVVKP